MLLVPLAGDPVLALKLELAHRGHGSTIAQREARTLGRRDGDGTEKLRWHGLPLGDENLLTEVSQFYTLPKTFL